MGSSRGVDALKWDINHLLCNISFAASELKSCILIPKYVENFPKIVITAPDSYGKIFFIKVLSHVI